MNGQIFISDGYVFLPSPFLNLQSGNVPLFPFLTIEINNWHGVQETSTSPFIKAYKAKLYTLFPPSSVNQIQDIGNRTQTEPYISKILEIYLLAYSSLYTEAVQFEFQNTQPFSNQLPAGITPLDITLEDGHYRRLFSSQTLIREGGRVSNAFLGPGPLGRGQDLSNQRFTLVKPMGRGAVLRGIPHDIPNMLAGHGLVESYATNIRRRRNDRILIKSLDFLRRALVLERSGFYNEAYLNYFRVIEAFANVRGGRYIGPFLRRTFHMNVNQARRLIRARNSVTAHGSESLSYFREIGTFELYRVQECAFTLIKERLDS